MTTTHNQDHRRLSKSLQKFIAAKGYRVEVEHNRPVSILVTMTAESEMYYHFNKTEFYDIINTWLEEKEDVAIDNGDGTLSHVLLSKEEVRKDDKFMYGDFVDPNGGFTKVSLVRGEGNNQEILEGKFNFKKNEPFFKAKGVFNAIKNALLGTDLIDGFANAL